MAFEFHELRFQQKDSDFQIFTTIKYGDVYIAYTCRSSFTFC